MTNQPMREKHLKLELGRSFWFGISFAAGCFGFGWIPFISVMAAGTIFGDKLT